MSYLAYIDRERELTIYAIELVRAFEKKNPVLAQILHITHTSALCSLTLCAFTIMLHIMINPHTLLPPLAIYGLYIPCLLLGISGTIMQYYHSASGINRKLKARRKQLKGADQ